MVLGKQSNTNIKVVFLFPGRRQDMEDRIKSGQEHDNHFFGIDKVNRIKIYFCIDGLLISEVVILI